MSSFSIVLLSRFAGIDQRSGKRGGADTDTRGGFPTRAGFVLRGLLARFGTLYFAHRLIIGGFVVGRGVIGCVSHVR